MHMQTHNSLTKNEMTSFGLLIKVNRDCKIVIYQHIFVSFPVKKVLSDANLCSCNI